MTRDYWPTEGWHEASPESMGADPAYLSALEREIEVRFGSINGFVMVFKGHVVFERYYHRFGPDDAHRVASVTKSVTSALVGIAIDKGYIEGVRQKVLGFFPEVTTQPQDVLKREVTIEHLLTMTAGFQWRTGARAFEPLLVRMQRGADWVGFILDLPVLVRSFGTFQYSSAASHLLSAILTRATGQCARAFANEHLFAPIGIAEIPANPQGDRETQWAEDPQGNSIGGWGLALKPRDMARFGFLYLNGGRWEGKQVVPRGWVDASISPHTPGYGYQWWLRDLGGVFVYAAVGRGGHHIFCVPERDLVVAIASRPGGRWRDRWSLLEEFVIPSIMG
jgi:CubicO group peptidase (beta-lactamase class C family)